MRDVNGNWSPNVTKTVVLQVLATTPQPIDAVWTSGSEARIVDEAFAQAGRPIPLVSGSISGDALGYWKEHPDEFKFTGGALMPSWTAQTLFRVGVRVLEGQQPKLNITHGSGAGSEAGRTRQVVCLLHDHGRRFGVPGRAEDPLPDTMMDAYFVKPAPVALFDYAQTPDPCAAK